MLSWLCLDINERKIDMFFEKTKMFFSEQIEKINSLLTKPTAFVESEDPKLCDDDYYAFEMVTNEWVDEHGVTHPTKHSLIVEPHEGTWMEVLDNILDEMEKHYGYSIKEQVYYSVEFPINEIDDRTGQPFAGYGRCLNDQMLQQLLLAFPEVYETTSFVKPAKNVFEA
jgi:hypothetical protein